MRSLIILEVEHGETTDPLQTIVTDLAGIDWVSDLKITDWAVRVDVEPDAMVEFDEFPSCTICFARNVEDAGDHADATGHFPKAAQVKTYCSDRCGLHTTGYCSLCKGEK